MVKCLCMTLVYCPGFTGVQEGWQYQSPVDFQLGVKLDFISTESLECYAGFYNSGSDIINVHCSGEGTSQVGEFINNIQFCPFTVMVDSWFEQLTKFCEPLRKMRVRLGAC